MYRLTDKDVFIYHSFDYRNASYFSLTLCIHEDILKECEGGEELWEEELTQEWGCVDTNYRRYRSITLVGWDSGAYTPSIMIIEELRRAAQVILKELGNIFLCPLNTVGVESISLNDDTLENERFHWGDNLPNVGKDGRDYVLRDGKCMVFK